MKGSDNNLHPLYRGSNCSGSKEQVEGAIMDLSISSNASDNSNNFEFAFNSSNFSDRILKIEIVASANENKEDEGCSSLADWARHRKRRREDIKKEKGDVFV